MWDDNWLISQLITTRTGLNKFYLRLYTKESSDFEELQILPDSDINTLDVSPDDFEMLKFCDLMITFKNDNKIVLELSGFIPCRITENESDDDGYEFQSTLLKLCPTIIPKDQVIDNNSESLNFINNMLKQHGLTQIHLVKNSIIKLFKPNTFVANCNIMNLSHYIKKTIKQGDNYGSFNEKLTTDELKPLYDFFIFLQKKQSLTESNTLEDIHKKVEKEPSTKNPKDKYLGNRDLTQYTKQFLSTGGKKTRRQKKKKRKRKKYTKKY